MRFVPIGQEEEKPGLRFVPLSQPTEEAPALVSPEEMLTPTAGAPITPTEMAKAVGERLVGGAKYIAGTEEEKRGSLIGDIVTGVERANVGAAGIFRAIAESTAPVLDPITGKILPENPLRRIASEFERLGVESEARAKARAPKGEQDVLSAGVSSGVQSLTQTLMAIPMALLPGGQPAALTMLSTNTGGNAYQEARNKGLSPAQAIPYAVSQASIEYATEVMPLTKLVSDINQKTGFGKLLMNQIVREVPGEQIATVLQDMNDWAVLNPEKTAQQYLEERPSAAAQTLVATIVGVGGNVIVGKALQSVVGAAAPEVTEEAVPEKKEPVFVPLGEEAVTPVTPEAPEVPAAPVTPPVTAVTEEEEGPMFTEELVTEREVRAAKPAEPAKATISQEEFTKLESDLAQVRAKQLDPTLSLDDPKLVEYQQQEADIRAKIDAARGVTPVTESLYDRLIKASPTELKKIDIPTSEAPDLYLRASEDENASPALVKKLTKIVNEMGPEEFAAPTVEPAAEPVTPVTPKAGVRPTSSIQSDIRDLQTAASFAAQKRIRDEKARKDSDKKQILQEELDKRKGQISKLTRELDNARRVEEKAKAKPLKGQALIDRNQEYLGRGEFIPDEKGLAWSDSKDPAKTGDLRRYLIDTPEGKVQVNLDFTESPGFESAIYGLPTSETGYRSLVSTMPVSITPRGAEGLERIKKTPYEYAQQVVKEVYEEKKKSDAKAARARKRAEKFRTVEPAEVEDETVIDREVEQPVQLSDAEKVTVVEELLDGLRFGDTIDLDNQKSVQELLGISRGFDAPVARRLMAIAKVPKAIQDKVMKQRPTTIDELSEFIAPLSKESAARAKDEKLFAQAKELAKTDEDVRQALDIYQSYKNMMEAIATERGKYGVKWAERNVSARWMEQSQKAKKAKQRVIDLMKIKPAVKKPAEKSKVEIKEEKAKANQLRQEVQKEIAKNYERDLEIDPSAGEILGNIKTINKFKVYKVKYGSETQYRVQTPFNRAMNRIGLDDTWHSDLGNARAQAEGSEALTPEQFVREKEYYAERAAREAAPKVEEEVTAVTPEVVEKPAVEEPVAEEAAVEAPAEEVVAEAPVEEAPAEEEVAVEAPTVEVSDEEVAEQLKRFEAGNFNVQTASATYTATKEQRASIVDMNDNYRDIYVKAANIFLESPIKAKPGKLELTDLLKENISPAPIKRSIVVKKKTFDDQIKNLDTTAAKDDIRFYLKGIYLNLKDNEMVSTDGHRLTLWKEPIFEGMPPNPTGENQIMTPGRDFITDAKYPDYKRVVPEKHSYDKTTVKAESLGDYARGVNKAAGYVGREKFANMGIQLGDKLKYFNSKYIADMTDVFRRFGYDTFELSLGDDKDGRILAVSPDGKLVQVIMGMRTESSRFAPYTVPGVTPVTKKAPPSVPLENISLAQIDRNLPGAKKRLPPGRSPELTAAAAQVKDGTMSAAEYDELVNKYKPIPVYTEAMKPATPEQVFDALDVAKRDKINPKIANGTPVGLRLDIPAFNRKGVFVVSIHKKRTPSAAGPVIGYGSVAKVTDATFGLGKETKALDIAAGASKDVLQTIEGKWNNISPEQAYKEAQEAINNPEWVQIGIDPTRHSYFYDRRTTLPIVKADEVIQIGNMLLGKGVEFGKKEDFLYNIESGPQLTERVIFEGISNARKQQLDELGRLARKKSELIKKIRNYGSDIETQRLLNELQDQIKIYRSGTAAKEPVTSAETFLKHARDAIDGTGMFREKSLDPEVFAVIQAAYIKTPWVLEGLRLSIKTPKQEGRASGIFIPMDRIVRLYRGTEGVEDPNTVRHELMHSLEQMMTGGAKDAVIQAWAKAFERAIKKYTDKKSQEYFKRVMDFLETPSAENRDKATEALPSYELYQYINPSEYWAVNAEKLYASQLGTAWDRFKKAIKKLFEGLKSVFGFNNTYAVHKLFDQIMGSAPGRMNRSSLTDYLLAGKAKIDFLENVQDDQKLIDKYKRPQTPMLNTEPVKNFVVNQARFAKAFFKDAVANPVEAIDTLFNGMSRGVHYLRNKNIFMGAGLEVADQEKYAGMLRNSQGLAIASVALDNALHSPNIATQVIFRGGIKFNKKAGVFVAAKNDTDTSMLGVYKAEAKLKEKLGAQLGTDIIQGYLEAKRSRSIKEELAVRDQELENLRNQLDSMDPADPDYENVRNQVNQAVDDLLAIKKAADKINMSDEEIAEFIDREKVHPELREIMDNFTGTNQNLLKFWYQVGLLSEGRYKALYKIKDYVPWYRIMDDEQDVHSPVQSTTRSMTNIGKEKLFKSGKPKTVVDFVAEDNQTEFRIQPSSVVKVKVNGVEVQNYTANAKGEITFSQPLAQGDVVVIETAREIENMIDNMTRNVMRMTMNGLRQYASTRIVQEYASRNEKGKIMVFPKADRNKGRFDYIANGRRVVVEIKDPLVAEAIFGMENIGLETFKAFAAVANMTRRMITMNPLFQVKQVFKDGPSAAFITGVKNPYGMVADVYTSFIKALKGDDETVDILRAAGIGGFQSPTRTPEAEIKRKIGVINKSNYDIVMAALDQFGDSSDVAQRKAIYDRVMKETGDEMRAIYQASTIMPFHRHGSGRVAQAIIKTVPFMGAYANSIDVLARALIGGNIKGMNRKKAMKYLGGAFIALSSVSLLYAFVAGLDDDYWELDDQTRLRNVILPFSKKLTGEMIMMPMNTGAAFIFKAIPELIYNYVITKGTDKQIDKSRAAKAFGEAAVDSLLGPEPIPSAVKPIIEIGLNRNFFTSRELTPKGMEDLEAADQFTAATSELGKMMGSVTDKLNPIEADHLIRSIFGTVGAMVQWSSNLIFAASRPEMTIKELPVTGAFVAPKYPRGKEDLFYDFLERTRKKHATFTDRLDRMDVDSAVDYMEKNAGLIVLYDYASQLEAELKEINKDIRLYSRASQDLGLTSKERREIIDGLNTIKRGKLEGIEIFRNLSEEIKVTE